MHLLGFPLAALIDRLLASWAAAAPSSRRRAEGRTPDEALAIAKRAGLRSPELALVALEYATARGATGR